MAVRSSVSLTKYIRLDPPILSSCIYGEADIVARLHEPMRNAVVNHIYRQVYVATLNHTQYIGKKIAMNGCCISKIIPHDK